MNLPLNRILICFMVLLCTVTCGSFPTVASEDKNVEDVYKLCKATKYDDAIQLAKELNAAKPGDIETYIALANAYFNKGRHSGVHINTDYLEQTQGKKDTYKIDIDDVPNFISEDATYDEDLVDSTIETLEKGLEIAPKRSDVYLGICYMAQESGRHDKLIETIKKTVEAFGDSNDILETVLAYGDNYLQKNNKQYALDVYGAILEKRPDYEFAVSNYGTVQLMSGKMDGAILYLKKASVLDPKDLYAWGGLMNAYVITGDFEKAADTVDALILINPNDIKKYFWRASVYLNIDSEKSIQYWKEYLKKQEANKDEAAFVDAANSIMSALVGDEIDYDKMQDVLGALNGGRDSVGLLSLATYLIGKNPDFFPAYMARSGLYDGFDLDKLVEADMIEALRIYDNSPDKYSYITRDQLVFNLCRAYSKQGLHEKSAEAASQIKDEKENAYSLSIIYENVRDYAKAYHYYSICANNEKDPSSRNAKQKLEMKEFDEFRNESHQ